MKMFGDRVRVKPQRTEVDTSYVLEDAAGPMVLTTNSKVIATQIKHILSAHNDGIALDSGEGTPFRIDAKFEGKAIVMTIYGDMNTLLLFLRANKLVDQVAAPSAMTNGHDEHHPLLETPKM